MSTRPHPPIDLEEAATFPESYASSSEDNFDNELEYAQYPDDSKLKEELSSLSVFRPKETREVFRRHNNPLDTALGFTVEDAPNSVSLSLCGPFSSYSPLLPSAQLLRLHFDATPAECLKILSQIRFLEECGVRIMTGSHRDTDIIQLPFLRQLTFTSHCNSQNPVNLKLVLDRLLLPALVSPSAFGSNQLSESIYNLIQPSRPPLKQLTISSAFCSDTRH
ncbi:hypothetical protein C8J56DRAFT_994222 [Mycena floridula]|nr:hypothetical protein C8J56DRAFT_994222 [Mycena floridula]